MEKDPFTFSFKLDYSQNREDPHIIFKAIHDLLISNTEIDKEILSILPVAIDSKILLQEIESGSIRVVLKNILSLIDDEDIKELNYKRAIGKYLLKSKHYILDKLENEEDKIFSLPTFNEIIQKIIDYAKELKLSMLPAIKRPSKTSIFLSIKNVNAALGYLGEKETVVFESEEGKSIVNHIPSLSELNLIDIATSEKEERTLTALFKVKKPDYLGASKWTFKWGSRQVDAKILDTNWLSQFHSRQIVILPGDSLRVIIKQTLIINPDSDPSEEKIEIIEILSHKQTLLNSNQKLPFD